MCVKCRAYRVVKNAVRGAVRKSPRNNDRTLRTNTNLFFFSPSVSWAMRFTKNWQRVYTQ